MMDGRHKYMSVLVVSTAFVAGFSLMGFEMFGTRVLAPFFGSGMPVWGATISVIMAGMGVGYAFGGKLADKRPSIVTLAALLLSASLFMCAFPLFGKPVCHLIDSFGLSRRVAALISASLLFPFPVFFLGAVSPLLVKLKVASMSDVGSGSGCVYAAGTAGGVIGTLFSSYIFIGLLSSPVAIAIFGLLLLVNALVLFLTRINTHIPE